MGGVGPDDPEMVYWGLCGWSFKFFLGFETRKREEERWRLGKERVVLLRNVVFLASEFFCFWALNTTAFVCACDLWF